MVENWGFLTFLKSPIERWAYLNTWAYNAHQVDVRLQIARGTAVNRLPICGQFRLENDFVNGGKSVSVPDPFCNSGSFEAACCVSCH